MTRTPHPTVVAPLGDRPCLILRSQTQELRFELGQSRHQLGRDPDWSDLCLSDQGWDVLSRRHAVLVQEGNSYRIFDGDRQIPSSNGLFHNYHRITVSEGLLLDNGMQLAVGQDPKDQILITYLSTNTTTNRTSTQPSKFHLKLRDLQEWPVELGREVNAQRYASVVLDAPTVSRLHAVINRHAQGQHILEDRSTNGTFVNGQRVTAPRLLQAGDTLRIGPFTLVYRNEILELFDRGSQIRLDAHQLLRQVVQTQGQNKGKTKTLLQNISLPIEPGQLVALVGGSGAGKSTLMRTLLGIEPTTQGKVYLNGDDLRQCFGLYRSQIGYVPQDDIVHLDLTVTEVLTYACQLRLPPDTNVKQVVARTIEQVKLSTSENTLVRSLSGGQRKRLSIGVELLADPKLFFLDEPTSGLDPGLDKEMMYLLRELADQGRTIVLVTHATSNINVCDRIAFLGFGGYLCYFGPPQEALKFFQEGSQALEDFADIYLKLDQGKTEEERHKNVQTWAAKYAGKKGLESEFYKKYIQASLSPGKESQFNTTSSNKSGISIWRQLTLLCDRHWQLLKRDPTSLSLALLTAPVGIILITLTVHGKTPLAKLDPLDVTQAPLAIRVLFVFTCAAIWVALSSSVQEIVREASIYFRERLVSLRILSYLSAKVAIFSGLALLQTLLISLVILVGFKSPNSELLPWPIGLGITTFLTLLANMGMGLMLSASVRNPSQATNLLPLLLLPQIIFSGVLFKLEGFVSKLAWLMPSRWSVAAYGALVNVNAMVPEPMAGLMGAEPPPQPFEPTSIYDPTWQNFGLSLFILLVHFLVYLAAAFWLQKRKDLFQ